MQNIDDTWAYPRELWRQKTEIEARNSGKANTYGTLVGEVRLY